MLHRVTDCPPLPRASGAQGIILQTDRGEGVLTTPDAYFRADLLHTLQACLGWSLRMIGDVDIEF